MGRKKGMSTKDPERPLTDYEKERCVTIEKNIKVLEQLGLTPLVKQLTELQHGHERKRNSSAEVYDKDEDYLPSDEALENEENQDEDIDDTVTISKGVIVLPTKGENKKQPTTTKQRKKQQMCPAMSMIDYLKQQQKEKEAMTQQPLQPQEACEIQQPQETSQNNGESQPLRASGAVTAEHTLPSRAATSSMQEAAPSYNPYSPCSDFAGGSDGGGGSDGDDGGSGFLHSMKLISINFPDDGQIQNRKASPPGLLLMGRSS